MRVCLFETFSFTSACCLISLPAQSFNFRNLLIINGLSCNHLKNLLRDLNRSIRFAIKKGYRQTFLILFLLSISFFILCGILRQLQFFECSICQFILSSRVGFFGIKFFRCHSLLIFIFIQRLVNNISYNLQEMINNFLSLNNINYYK